MAEPHPTTLVIIDCFTIILLIKFFRSHHVGAVKYLGESVMKQKLDPKEDWSVEYVHMVRF